MTKNGETQELKNRLQKKNALCPICEKHFKKGSEIFSFENKDDPYVKYLFNYIICNKCDFKLKFRSKNKKIELLSKIENKLVENEVPYSCELKVDDIDYGSILNKELNRNKKFELNALINTAALWHKNDELFFKQNPNKRFLARPLYENELDDTNRENEKLKKDAIDKGISFAIIHLIADKQRVYTYSSDLTGHPYKEEEFVAALFMVRVNDLLKEKDIYILYEQIKKNKQIIKDFNLTEENNINKNIKK